MVGRIDYYSLFVSFAKVILPLGALAILSSLFLFSNIIDPTIGAKLIEGRLQEFIKKERITRPHFEGMTVDGIAIQLSAESASPRVGGGIFDAEKIDAQVELEDGTLVAFQATRGLLNALNHQADLTDGILLTSSDGNHAKTHGLSFATNRFEVHSQGSVTADIPLGKIYAGEFDMRQEPSEDPEVKSGYVLNFKKGVKLIYDPTKNK